VEVFIKIKHIINTSEHTCDLCSHLLLEYKEYIINFKIVVKYKIEKIKYIHKRCF